MVREHEALDARMRTAAHVVRGPKVIALREDLLAGAA